jgi:transposase
LPDEQRAGLERDFRETVALGEKAGLQRIIEEVRFRDLDLDAELHRQNSFVNKALWTYLNCRPVFERAARFAIRYLVRTGCGSEMLPSDFLPWQTVYWWFRRFVRRLLFNTIHDIALMVDRERAGRDASRSAAVIDSQSVKAPSAKKRGFDAAKKITGRKRYIAVDTDGRLLLVNLTTADISDSAGAQMILDTIRKRWPWVKHLFADGAYDRGKLMDKAAVLNFAIEVVRRIEGQAGFHVLPRRWVVERTFGMMRWRRLVRDYEQRRDVSEAMIHIALGSRLPAPGSRLLRWIAH